MRNQTTAGFATLMMFALLGCDCGSSKSGVSSKAKPATRSLVADVRKERPKTVEELLTAHGIEIVRKADFVEAFKLEGLPHEQAPAGWDGGQKVVRMEVVAPPLNRELGEALVDSATYSLKSGRKRCGGFQPREAVRFWLNGESIAFSICFKCGDLGIAIHDSASNVAHEHFASFGPGRARLLELLRRAIPNDPYLLSVKEEH